MGALIFSGCGKDTNKDTLKVGAMSYAETLEPTENYFSWDGGAQRFPQNGWKSFAECKGIRELDCESYNSSRDESRVKYYFV